MKRFTYSLMIVLALLFVYACSEDENEQGIEISQVPQKVLAAVQDTLPGFEIEEAEVEGEGDDIKYELEGTFQSEKYEIEIAPDGTVLKVEKEKESDDDEEDN